MVPRRRMPESYTIFRMTSNDYKSFEEFTRPLVGMTVSQVWMGYGSAIFIDFGELSPKFRADGRLANKPQGEMEIFAVEGWRIEGKRRIWCGNASERERWERLIHRMKGASVVSISLTGRLGAIDLLLSNGLRFATFASDKGDPEWSLRDRRGIYIGSSAGSIRFDRRNQRSS
jgi:hypothetical protein